jgi:hypothetical protein
MSNKVIASTNNSMIYRHVFLFLFVLTFGNAYSQLQIDWQQSYGGSDEENSCNMVKLQDGYLIIGRTYSDDGPVSYNHGKFDFWIIRIDSLGNIRWEKSLGGSDDDYVWSAFKAAGSSDFYILGGSASIDGDITGDPFPGIYNNWLVRISEDGDIRWNRKFGTPNGMPFQKSGMPTSDGGLICSALAFENGGCVTSFYGYVDAWIAKIDSLGEIQWDFTMGTSDFEVINNVIQTSDGGFIVAMNGFPNDSTGNINCNCINNSADAIIFRIDSLGQEVWHRCYGGSNDEYLFSIAPFIDGYMVAGVTASTDGDLTNAGYHDNGDIWIFRTDLSGNMIWSKCFGGSDRDGLVEILPTPDGNFIAFGITDSRDGDVTGNATYSQYYFSIWAFKIDVDGHLLWQQCIGGTSVELVNGVNRFGMNRYAVSGDMEYSPSCDVNCSNFIPGTGFNLWEFVVTDVTDSTVRIPEHNSSHDLLVFPNPAHDRLQIRFPGKFEVRDCWIEFADVQGNVHYTGNFNRGTIELDLHGLPPGLYILKCSVIDGIIVRKVLIW